MRNLNVQNVTVSIPSSKMQESITKLDQRLYRYEMFNGQKFLTLPKVLEKRQFHRVVIDFGLVSFQVPKSSDYLTSSEEEDIKVSLAEIKAGKAKKFKSVEAFLKELKK